MQSLVHPSTYRAQDQLLLLLLLVLLLLVFCSPAVCHCGLFSLVVLADSFPHG